MLLCTTHIHWNPRRDFVKYGQALNLHTNISLFMSKNNLKQDEIPIIITGDFNSRPSSTVINIMYGNPLFIENYDLSRVKDEDKKVYELIEANRKKFESSLIKGLRSAYENFNPPKTKNENDSQQLDEVQRNKIFLKELEDERH